MFPNLLPALSRRNSRLVYSSLALAVCLWSEITPSIGQTPAKPFDVAACLATSASSYESDLAAIKKHSRPSAGKVTAASANSNFVSAEDKERVGLGKAYRQRNAECARKDEEQLRKDIGLTQAQQVAERARRNELLRKYFSLPLPVSSKSTAPTIVHHWGYLEFFCFGHEFFVSDAVDISALPRASSGQIGGYEGMSATVQKDGQARYIFEGRPKEDEEWKFDVRSGNAWFADLIHRATGIGTDRIQGCLPFITILSPHLEACSAVDPGSCFIQSREQAATLRSARLESMTSQSMEHTEIPAR